LYIKQLSGNKPKILQQSLRNSDSWEQHQGCAKGKCGRVKTLGAMSRTALRCAGESAFFPAYGWLVDAAVGDMQLLLRFMDLCNKNS